ncbi:MAG: GNAT family N-acetyltransferase [Crinalium sp.]
MQLTSNIVEVNSEPQLSKYLPQLIELYKKVFAEPPEYQVWSSEKIREFFDSYLHNGHLFVAFDLEYEPIAFCAIVPFIKTKVWDSQVSDGNLTHTLNQELLQDRFGIDVSDTWYIADLIVDAKYRRQGLATELMKTAITGKQSVILRVSLCRESAIALYKKLGFNPMNLFQTAKYKQVNGGVKTFEKMLMLFN